MPNQGNKGKEKAGIVQEKRKPTMPDTEKQETTKQSKGSNAQKSGKGSTSKGQSKTASGDSAGD